MDALFGRARAAQLRPRLEGMEPEERELIVVEEICEALKEKGGRYVLPFRFRHPTKGRTSHHLVFVSKHVRGYEIMKEIMAKESSTADQGVPSFEYNPMHASLQPQCGSTSEGWPNRSCLVRRMRSKRSQTI